MKPLRAKMLRYMERRGYSEPTVKTYIVSGRKRKPHAQLTDFQRNKFKKIDIQCYKS
ncbi:MAG: hypothetical protein H6559_24460 [Lewinellaceae bacterium]|nr:hypothetical protein [Lewinellaceae bacterium]